MLETYHDRKRSVIEVNYFHTPKSRARYHIEKAHEALLAKRLDVAQFHLTFYRIIYNSRPASTKRRWACGK